MDAERLLARIGEARRAGRHRRALELADTGLNAFSASPVEPAFRLERASALLELRDAARAEIDCRSALDAGAPPGAQLLLSRCLLELERFAAARAAAEVASSEDPLSACACRIRAAACGKLGEHGVAVEAAREALRLEPGPAGFRSLCDALGAAGYHEERAERIERELVAGATGTWLYCALGLSHYALDRADAAVDAFERAIALEPHSVEAHCGLAWVLLRLGRYAEGFRHQEYRQAQPGGVPRLGVPPLTSGFAKGERVFVYSEQGFGDTLQFSRYLPRLLRAGADTTFYVASPLGRVLESSGKLGRLSHAQPRFGDADKQVLLMSLPHLLGLDSDLATGELPLLLPEPERVAHFRRRLPRGPKVALAWQGNPKYGGEPWRSMPFRFYAPLIERFRGRITFLSLQKHVGRDQLASSKVAEDVLDLGDEIDRDGAFVDSLAILSLVDRFVGTDSALAHVAGSAALPAFTLLSNVADWRWGRDPSGTPWYPSLRLFRQPTPGDWSSVIERVSDELSRMLERSSRETPGAHLA